MPVCFCFFQIKIQQPYIHVCLSVPPQHWDYRKVPSFSCGAGDHTWSLCFQDQRLAKPQPQSQRIFFMTSFFRSVLIFQPCAFDLSIWAHSDGPDGMLSLPALASLHSGVCSYQLGVTNNGVDVLLRREGEEKNLSSSWCCLAESQSRSACSASLSVLCPPCGRSLSLCL